MTPAPLHSSLSDNEETPAMHTYRQLLILGFPEPIAASSVLAIFPPQPAGNDARPQPQAQPAPARNHSAAA